MIQRYGNFASGATIPKIVLAGRPNAGKSSLFNALLCRYRAIVHDEPGTTRDVIEEEIEVEGRRWKLVDTAGFREGITSAEREGIAMGQDFLSDSSVWVLVVDGRETLSFEDIYLLEKYGSKKPFVILWNKSDLPGFRPPESISGKTVVCGSARQGDKLEEFWERLRHTLARVRVDDFGPLPTSTQAARLRFVVEELQGLVADLAAEVPPEYLAEKNRSVIARLESVVGEIGTEDVLDRVFGEFCIGK